MSNGAHGGWFRGVARAGTAAMAVGAVAFASVGTAQAQPSSDQCSPAALMRTHATAMSQMADYLDAHPDVSQAITNARNMPTAEQRQAAMTDYNATHPDVAAAFQNMHQPVANLMTVCGLYMDQTMMMPGGMMMPGNEMMPGQMMPGSQMPGQMVPGSEMMPGQMMPGSQMPGQ